MQKCFDLELDILSYIYAHPNISWRTLSKAYPPEDALHVNALLRTFHAKGYLRSCPIFDLGANLVLSSDGIVRMNELERSAAQACKLLGLQQQHLELSKEHNRLLSRQLSRQNSSTARLKNALLSFLSELVKKLLDF